MAGILDFLFKKQIDKRVQMQLNPMINTLRNMFNQNVYQMLFDGQIVIKDDAFDYVEDAFQSVGAVYECVDIIVKKIIACPRIVYRVKDEKELKKYYALAQSPDTQYKAAVAKAKALEEVSHKQIEKLLYNPNPKENGDAVLEMIAGLYLLTGNSYLYGNAGSQSDIDKQKWSEVWAIPGPMQIQSGGFTKPIESYTLLYWKTDNPFPAQQIKHFKTANYRYTQNGSQLYGMAPLRAYHYSLDTYKNAERQSDKQIKNGGKLGLITPENKEDNFTEPQLDDIHESLRDAHHSDVELDRLVPLSVAVKYQQVGLSSQEMELLKTQDVKADDVYRAYHIPLQFRNQDTATYNNLPVANRQLVYNAVCPPLRRIEQGLTEFYATPYNTTTEKFIIMLDYTQLPELNDDMKTVADWLDKCDDLTPNEKREVKGWGRSSEPGMDQIWLSKNKVPMADVLAGKVNYASSPNPTTNTRQ